MSDVGASPLNVLSICAGGGGLDLGFELAIPSARPVCLVEIEAFAIAHLVAAMQAGLVADCPVWTDARTFDGRPWRGVVDCLIGGIPCQAHSVAGRKLGQLDERDLWSTARRIIVQCRPRVVLIENVAGMLSAGADQIAGAERVWRDLRKLGFAVEGGLFTASEVGAPHQRERVFILGVADRDQQYDDRPWRQSGGRGKPTNGVGDVAEPAGTGPQRRGAAGDLRGPAGEVAGEAPERERRRHTADDGGEDVGHHDHARPQGRRERPDERAGERAARAAGEQLGHGTREREPRGSDRGLFPPGPGDDDAWATTLRHAPELLPATSRYDRFRIAVRDAHLVAMVDPSAREAWLDPEGPYGLRPTVLQEIAQSALRERMADGLAPWMVRTRVEVGRVDRLRLGGNGVVPATAAFAVCTLVRRLAARNADGHLADRLWDEPADAAAQHVRVTR